MKTKKNILGAAAAIVAAAMLTIPATALAQDPVGKRRAPSKQQPAKKAPAAKKSKPKVEAPSEEAPEVYHAPAEEGDEVTEGPAPGATEPPATESPAGVASEPASEATEAAAEEPHKPRGDASDADWAAAEEGIVRRDKERRDRDKQPAKPAAKAAEKAAPLATSVMPPYAITPHGPDHLEWSEGMAIPPGYKKGTKVRKGLVIGGAITFGASWLLSIAAATALIDEEENNSSYTYDEGRDQNGTYYRSRHSDDDNDFPDAAPLYIPLVGPFIAIHTLGAEDNEAAALAFDGVVQLAGFGMFVAGLAAKKTVLVRDHKVDIAVAPGPGSLMFKAVY
jgi:hypothetical protein